MQRIRQLLRYVRDYKGLIAGNIVSNLLMVIFSIISIPILIPFLEILLDRKELITERPDWAWNADKLAGIFNYELSQIIIDQGKETALLWLCGGIVCIYFFKNLFRYLSLFFMAPVRNGIIRDIRQRLYDKTLGLPLSYFSEERKGDLISRITSDVQEIEWSILNVLEIVVREPLMIIGALAFMIYLSPQLTIFVFILLIFTGLIIGGIGRVLKRQSTAVQERLGSLIAQLEETLSGLRIIKGFNAEKYQSGKFLNENNSYRKLLTRLLWRRDLSSPLSEFLGISVVAVLIWFGFREVQSGTISVAAFIAFLYAFFSVIDPAKKFSTASYNIQKGIAAVERTDKILKAVNDIREPAVPKPLHRLDQSIEFSEVCFSYRNSEGPVLQNINFSIPKGKTIALVGSSGAGKSTLADLLPRFYDVDQGKITIDGTDIRDFHTQELRSLMGIVSQEAVLFNDTIYNNITFGTENTGIEQVEAAARVANAHEFIMATDKGYETNIGDRGMKLSGGQRQRLTIARAILKDPPVLILDEATSALDSESEKLVQEALEKLLVNRTSLVIAHRLSTIQHADEILVMREGRIIERGTHSELLSRKGEYRKLVELQAV